MKSILVIALLLALAACAPALNPVAQFPLKKGEVWKLEGRAPNGRVVNERVQLETEPKQDGSQVSATIRTDSLDGIALTQKKEDIEFFSVGVIETTTPFRMTQCFFLLENRATSYSGWAVSGTTKEMLNQVTDLFDNTTLPKPSCTLTKQ